MTFHSIQASADPKTYYLGNKNLLPCSKNIFIGIKTVINHLKILIIIFFVKFFWYFLSQFYQQIKRCIFFLNSRSRLLSFLNTLSYRCEIGLEWQITSSSFCIREKFPYKSHHIQQFSSFLEKNNLGHSFLRILPKFLKFLRII